MTTHYSDESSPLLDIYSRPRTEVWPGAESHSDARAEPNYRVLATAWVIAATVIRFVSVASLPLGNGEAYYYSWSRFLDWSYYDHPPLVAWMVRLTTLFGSSPAAVRLGPILAAGAFGLIFYRLAERLYRPRAAFFGLILVTALPVFLGSSFILNPEAPLAPLWVGFLFALEGMRRRDGWHRPIVAGVLLGSAFLAKYTAVLLLPATLLYLVCSAPARRWLRRPSFYAGGLVALAITLPVTIWNETRGWPSLRLHLVERATAALPVAGENRINQLVAVSSSSGTGLVGSFLRVLVGQLMSYSPLLAPLLIIALVRALRQSRRDDRSLFITAFSWPVLLPLLAAMTRFQDAEQHWTMVAFVPAVIAAGAYVDEAWSRARLVRGLMVAGVLLSGIVFFVANVHARTTTLLRLIPTAHYDARADMINELIGWDELRAGVTRAATAAHGNVVLASNHYSLCGRLLYETGDSPAVYCPTARRSSFDFFDRHDPPADATVIALTTDIHEELPDGLEGRSCTTADPIDIDRGGRRVARYFIQTCAPTPVDSEKRATRD
jgi:hypothetical protein